MSERQPHIKPFLLPKAVPGMLYVLTLCGLLALGYELAALSLTGRASLLEWVAISSMVLVLFGAALDFRRHGNRSIGKVGFLISTTSLVYLVIVFSHALLIRQEPLHALHYLPWFVAIHIAAAAWLPRALAQCLSWSAVTVTLALASAYWWRADMPSLFAPEIIALVQGLLAQIVAVSMILVLSIYREAHAAARTRIRLLEDTAQTLMQAADQAETARQAAETADMAKSRFLATMSHELRTPLNAIIGFSDLLAQEAFGPHVQARYRDYAADIACSGRHLLNLLETVLDYSALTEGPVTPAAAPIDLAKEAKRAIGLLTDVAAPAAIAITLDAPTPVWLRAEQRAMQQILRHLLSNAVKFTPAGGQVTVAVRLSQDHEDEAVLEIRDTGCGIPEDQIKAVLAPFARLSDPMRANEGGIGLGLSLVKSLVERHGGHLSLVSRPDQGTIVAVHLPRRGLMAVEVGRAA